MEWTSGDRLALLSTLACLLAALALMIVYRMKMTPPERERRRRLKLNLLGRMGDAIVTDAHDNTLYFSYTISGVAYHASQDVAMLRHLLPDALSLVIGAATIKYLPRNPANSIVICEQWSGLRIRADALAAGGVASTVAGGGEPARAAGT
jgi:hypothetical protein